MFFVTFAGKLKRDTRLKSVMHKKLLHSFVLVPFLLLPAVAVHAQQSTPGKKALVSRILKLQQPGIEGMSRTMVEGPASQLLARAGSELGERVAADKRDAVGKEIQADVKKFLDETVPLVSNRAIALAPSTIGSYLEEKFNEDELKQIAVFLESPAVNKYQRLSGEMQNILVEKVLTDMRSVVDPKVAALAQTLTKRVGGSGTNAPVSK